MQPRAYFPAPVGVSLVGVSYSRNSGDLLFDPSLLVQNANVVADITTLSFAQTLGVMGRSAQVLAIVPYAKADMTGTQAGFDQYRYRSGLGDTVYRYAMNIYGAPAMHMREFVEYRPKTIVGASITVSAPTGQHDPNVLINIGANRWAFKPELGVSRTLGKWSLEGAAGAWLFTSNNAFAGGKTLTQVPLGSIQGHVVRILPRRTWAAFDTTFFTGGRTSVNGRDMSTYVANYRIGATFGMVIGRRQSIRISYFKGAIARIGSDIDSIGIAYSFIVVKAH